MSCLLWVDAIAKQTEIIREKKLQTCTQRYKKKEDVFKIIRNCDNQSPLAAYVKDMCSQQKLSENLNTI